MSKSIDIATGYFEIGALLALDAEWQKVDGIRLLMGDEVSRRTKRAFDDGLARIADRLDQSIETEKKKNDFLDGVAAIAEAIRLGKIQCRVYRKDKFHAKAYITHARMEVIGSAALVGSSNFTFPGLTQNVELNVQITGSQVAVLQEWFDEHWDNAEDVTLELLKVIERHVRDYTPFQVYAKSLQEFFKGHELTATEWERNHSAIYKILAPYQREGYHAMLKRADRYKGAFLCDGVGLGKTYVGLMLIERLIVHDRLKVALFVPKSGRKPVWERALRQRLPSLFGKYSQLEIFNHTDLMRGGQTAEDRRILVGQAGCSKTFIVGKLDVGDPAALQRALAQLRADLMADPYFKRVPSMQPERGKTARAFHAKDDVAEVRREVFKVLVGLDLRFYAVVRHKAALLDYVRQRNEREAAYRYRGDELYDTLVEELFRRYHPFADRLEICFAKRGSKSRTHAFRSAIEKAEARFESQYGVRRSTEVAIVASTPPETAGLQAVDYCLWALQRHCERDESRYIELIWDKVVEIEDMDRIEGGRRGVVYNKKRPLIADQGALE